MTTVKTVEAGSEEREMRAEKVSSNAALRVQLAEVGGGGAVAEKETLADLMSGLVQGKQNGSSYSVGWLHGRLSGDNEPEKIPQEVKKPKLEEHISPQGAP